MNWSSEKFLQKVYKTIIIRTLKYAGVSALNEQHLTQIISGKLGAHEQDTNLPQT